MKRLIQTGKNISDVVNGAIHLVATECGAIVTEVTGNYTMNQFANEQFNKILKNRATQLGAIVTYCAEIYGFIRACL